MGLHKNQKTKPRNALSSELKLFSSSWSTHVVQTSPLAESFT